MQTFVLMTLIAAPASDCFELSLSVDAHTQSMGRSAERAVSGVTTGVLSLGDSVTWQARHFGIPFRMTATVTVFDAPRCFVDEQSRGPFKTWHHEHRFQPGDDAATTLVIDTVRFVSPIGPVGTAVDSLILSRYMPRLLRQRNRWLKTTLEAARS